MTTNKCPWCDKTFEPTKYIKVFCSVNCFHDYNRTTAQEKKSKPKKCLVCKTDFIHENYRRRTCSEACRLKLMAKSKTQQRVIRECTLCGKQYPSLENARRKYLFCSVACRAESERRRLSKSAKELLHLLSETTWTLNRDIKMNGSIKNTAFKRLLYLDLIEVKRTQKGTIKEAKIKSTDQQD